MFMKGINDVVVCERKRLDDPAEFNRRAQTAQLLLYACLSVQFKSTSANPSNLTVRIVLTLPHGTYFHVFVRGEIWILCVNSCIK